MTRYKSLIALNFGVFLLMLGVGMVMALLPQKMIDLSNSVSTRGYLASIFAVSYLLLQVPLGNLADKIGFQVLLVVGYALCSLSGLLYHWAETPTLVFVGRLLQGAGEAPIWALAPALLSLQYPNAKGKVMGIYNASFHLGLAGGPLLGILLTRVAGLDDGAFLFYAVVSFAGGLIVYWLVDNPRSSKAAKLERFDLGNILTLVTNRQNLVVLIGIALYGTGYSLSVTIIPAFLISVKGFDQASIGIFFSLFYIAISLSQLIAGPLSDKRGRQEFMVCGLILAASGMALFSSLQQPWINAPLTLASFGLGIFSLSSMAYLNERAPDSLKGTISGVGYLFWGLGYFLGPLIVANSGDPGKSSVSFYLLAGLMGVEAVVLIAIGAKDKAT